MALNEKIFREYDIRGVADKDLPDSSLRPLSRALGTYLRRKGCKQITLGRDCRLSSPRLHAQMLEGLLGSGLDVVDIGLVPTPMLYFSVFHLKMDGGIMITGSHNPPDHNGFKTCLGHGSVYGEAIQEVLQLAKKEDFETGKGTLTHDDVREGYFQTILRSVRHPLPLKVVVDNGNGMAGGVAAELYRRLGCEVIDLFNEPDGTFPNHHPDPTVMENLEDLIKAVKEHKAIAGIAFDGDADRIGMVDPTGRVIYGDELMVMYSRDILKDHPGAKIISEVKASHRLYQDIAKHGGVPIMWKTGHSLIKAKMKEEKALLAGEMSGHMFFNDRWYGFDDAIYAGARAIEIMHKEGKTPCQLLADLPDSFTTPEIRVDCGDDIKFAVVERSKKALEAKGYKVNGIDGARVEFGDAWGLVRASNTQPVLVFRFEAGSQARLDEVRKIVETIVKENGG